MDPKVIKTSPSSKSGVVVADNSVRINATEDNGINVDERGITFAGPISFVNGINQIRLGALFTFNNAIALTIPSTISTPTPVLMIDPPIKQIASLMKDTAIMMSLIGALSGSAVG
jgi:hypothetical protein